MKIGGIDPRTLPTEEILVLPRGDQRMVFTAVGLPDMAEFERHCPTPVPPMKMTLDGVVADTKDKNYQEAIQGHGKLRIGYMVVKSLVPSQIEWDTVRLDEPATWTNWDSDLRAAGLTQVECNRVLALVWEANCLDEDKLNKARDLFQRGTILASER